MGHYCGESGPTSTSWTHSDTTVLRSADGGRDPAGCVSVLFGPSSPPFVCFVFRLSVGIEGFTRCLSCIDGWLKEACCSFFFLISSGAFSTLTASFSLPTFTGFFFFYRVSPNEVNAKGPFSVSTAIRDWDCFLHSRAVLIVSSGSFRSPPPQKKKSVRLSFNSVSRTFAGAH